MSESTCRVCEGSVQLCLDIGRQPLCNRFLSQPTDEEVTYEFRLGQCQQCGLIQLEEPVSISETKPVKRLHYTEPEFHLDQVVRQIRTLPRIDSNARICGITWKDQSTIDRLVRNGFSNARCKRAKEDYQIDDSAAGIETIQERIALQQLTDKEQYHIVVARHIFEHAHQPRAFLTALERLLVPGGYLVLEVPDFTNSLRFADYSTLWEEHICYFTSRTLLNALENCGWDVQHLDVYPYVPEDSLVVVATKNSSSELGGVHSPTHVAEELTKARHYANQMMDVRQRWRQLFVTEKDAGRETALLGAGHLGIMFLNALNLGNLIDIVVDSDPEKCGRYLPGSHQRVYDMKAIYERPVKLCFLSVSPEGEKRVLERQREFIERGGEFRSIFPTSPLGWPSVEPNAVNERN